MQHQLKQNQLDDQLLKQQVDGQMISMEMRIAGMFLIIKNRFFGQNECRDMTHMPPSQPPILRQNTRRAAEEIIATGKVYN